MPLSSPKQQSIGPQKADRSTTVLFVDDNPDDLASWSTGLRECGSPYVILTASDGLAALDLCQDQQVDCVVLDLAMPPQSGLDTLLKLVPNRHHPNIAIVILTVLRNPSILKLARDYGAQACLNKSSTSIHALDEAIKKAIDTVSSRSNSAIRTEAAVFKDTHLPATTVLIIDGNDTHRQYYAHRLRTHSPDYLIILRPRMPKQGSAYADPEPLIAYYLNSTCQIGQVSSLSRLGAARHKTGSRRHSPHFFDAIGLA